MVYKIKLEQFEGPLDLLLQLIEQEEMDITKISLARVTDQYLGFLNSSYDIRPEELADFLVVAAKLLLIKSKILLPDLDIDEEETTDLEHQLKMYKEFHEASKMLNKMILKKKFLYPREKMVVKVDRVFNPPKSLTTDKLKILFLEVLRSLEPWVNLPREVMVKTISIKERIANIQEMIGRQAVLRFNDLLKTTKNKTEVIVTFLAVLELVKQHTVAVVQDNIFDDIVVKKVSEVSNVIINEKL
ncbi:segregation/condensation protein A [Patescibacteria group bacterium]|nr:segregation/condensation protein A [Patescibacteria group bacterium]MBU0964017.1 segregation/condensation protein A [Patescibacteria group bacterium]